MAIKSGIAAQAGLVDEVTYGTYVAPTRFHELRSENLKIDLGAIDSFPLGRGVYQRTLRRRHFVRGGGGDMTVPVSTNGMGLIFKHWLGSAAAAQQGVTDEYLITVQPDSAGKQGLKATVQVGRPDVGGTVQPFSYTGGKIVSGELSCETDGELLFKPTWDFENEETAQTLASATYASGDRIFTFDMADLEIGGSGLNLVKSFRLTLAHPMATDRRGLGNTKLEPLANAEWVGTLGLDFEFESLTRHGAWKAATEATNFIATFDSGVAVPDGDGGNFMIVITCPLIVPISGGPTVGGPGVVMEPYQYKILNDGTNPPVKIEITTDDTAV